MMFGSGFGVWPCLGPSLEPPGVDDTSGLDLVGVTAGKKLPPPHLPLYTLARTLRMACKIRIPKLQIQTPMTVLGMH